MDDWADDVYATCIVGPTVRTFTSMATMRRGTIVLCPLPSAKTENYRDVRNGTSRVRSMGFSACFQKQMPAL